MGARGVVKRKPPVPQTLVCPVGLPVISCSRGVTRGLRASFA